MELMDNEQIKQIKNFPLYYISSFGRVWSTISKKWLTPTVDQRGNHKRLYVSLGRNNKKYVHRLVAEAFIPNPLNLPEVDHIDADGTNNQVDNLRWCTQYQNMVNNLQTTQTLKKNTGYYVEIEEIATGKRFIGYEAVAVYSGLSKQAILNHVKGRVKNPRWRLTGQRFRENNLEKSIDKTLNL